MEPENENADAAAPESGGVASIEEPEVPIPQDASEVNVAPGEGESLFPPFDVADYPSHIFWIAISFGLLYFLVNRLIVPQVGGIIEDRRDRIASDLGEASRLSRETDEVIAAYEAELASARHKAHSIAQEKRDAIAAEQARRQAEIEADLNEKIAASEREIAERRDAALADRDAIASEAAQAIVEKIAGVSLSGDEAQKAVRAEISAN